MFREEGLGGALDSNVKGLINKVNDLLRMVKVDGLSVEFLEFEFEKGRAGGMAVEMAVEEVTWLEDWSSSSLAIFSNCLDMPIVGVKETGVHSEIQGYNKW